MLLIWIPHISLVLDTSLISLSFINRFSIKVPFVQPIPDELERLYSLYFHCTRNHQNLVWPLFLSPLFLILLVFFNPDVFTFFKDSAGAFSSGLSSSSMASSLFSAFCFSASARALSARRAVLSLTKAANSPFLLTDLARNLDLLLNDLAIFKEESGASRFDLGCDELRAGSQIGKVWGGKDVVQWMDKTRVILVNDVSAKLIDGNFFYVYGTDEFRCFRRILWYGAKQWESWRFSQPWT